jgi:hypothetical protein
MFAAGALNELMLVNGLLAALGRELREEAGLRQRLIAGWIDTIITAHAELQGNSGPSSNNNNNELYDMFGQDFQLNLKTLFRLVVGKPNKYTVGIIDKLKPFIPHAHHRQLNNLKKVIKSYLKPLPADKIQDKSTDNEGNDAGKVHTLAELLQEASESAASYQSLDVEDEGTSGWRVASSSSVPWGEYALGTCPTCPVLGYTALELPVTRLTKEEGVREEEEKDNMETEDDEGVEENT